MERGVRISFRDANPKKFALEYEGSIVQEESTAYLTPTMLSHRAHMPNPGPLAKVTIDEKDVVVRLLDHDGLPLDKIYDAFEEGHSEILFTDKETTAPIGLLLEEDGGELVFHDEKDDWVIAFTQFVND